jgi:hypothetical protein
MSCLNGSRKLRNAQKMPSGPKWSHYLDLLYFPHEVRFSAGIGPAHFPAGGTAIDACAAAIFTLLLYPYFVCQMAMDTSDRNLGGNQMWK